MQKVLCTSSDGTSTHLRKCELVKSTAVLGVAIRELLIYTVDGLCDGKTSNVASSPRRLSGPLRVVDLGGPTDGTANLTHAHMNDIRIPTVLESSVVQIESSLFYIDDDNNEHVLCA